MWYNNNNDIHRSFIFFLINRTKAINNSNVEKIFKNPWTPHCADRWRQNKFTSKVKQIAPELNTYWKDEE